MSTNCRGYLGYTINLKENLKHDDFEFFNEFEEKYPEYSDYQRDLKDKVILITDGMNGLYARLMFIEEVIEDCWIEGKDYFVLNNHSIPNDVYDKLNKAYTLMYNKELDKSLINYTLWFHFT